MALAEYRSKVVLSNTVYGEYKISYTAVKKQELTKGGKIKHTTHFNGTQTESKLSRDIEGTTMGSYEITLQVDRTLKSYLSNISSVNSGITTFTTDLDSSQVVLEEMPQIDLLGEVSTLMFIIEKELNN